MTRQFERFIGNGLVVAAVGLAVSMAFGPGMAQTRGREHIVPMANMRYAPIPGGLKVGDTIVWVNRDTVPHTVTARNKSFDIRLKRGQSLRMKLSKAGSFPFYCIYHPAMRGTLTVGV